MGRRTILTITTPLHRCLRRSDRQDRWRGARAMGSIRSEPAKPPAIWEMSGQKEGLRPSAADAAFGGGGTPPSEPKEPDLFRDGLRDFAALLGEPPKACGARLGKL